MANEIRREVNHLRIQLQFEQKLLNYSILRTWKLLSKHYELTVLKRTTFNLWATLLNRVIFLAIARPSTKKKTGLKGYYFGGEGERGWMANPPHVEQIPGGEGKGIQHDEKNN